jgi:hypothetical protein
VRSYVLPVLVRTAGLAAVSWAYWILGDVIEPADEDFTWLLAFIAVLAGIAALWAAVDGVRSARRGDAVRIGLVVWVLVAAAAGLLQPVLVTVQDLVTGRPLGELRMASHLRVALVYAVLVAVPAVLMFGVAWIAGRRIRLRPRQ